MLPKGYRSTHPKCYRKKEGLYYSPKVPVGDREVARMSPNARWEYMKEMYLRYHKVVGKKAKGEFLKEFCAVYKCHHKSAIRLLNGPAPGKVRPIKARGQRIVYNRRVMEAVEAMWRASNYLWSRNLKAAIPLWRESLGRRFKLSPQELELLDRISPATIDRRLKAKKLELKKHIYGKTKKSSYLLRHQIPIRTEFKNVSEPGWTEADTVSHSGLSASGLFAQTLNRTSILTQWVERRAMMGKSEAEVSKSFKEMDEDSPFDILGIDVDNGSEFINRVIQEYCRERGIKMTRSRPYKKDDQAHIEQKNKTHVRKWVGWLRYDSSQAVEALNDLYRNELRLFQNLFEPSVKLIKTVRRGSKSRRVFDKPQTPLDRLVACKGGRTQKVAQLVELRKRLDPFELSRVIDLKLKRIYALASKTPVQPLPPPRPAGTRWNPWLGSGSKSTGYSPEAARARRLYGKERRLQTW